MKDKVRHDIGAIASLAGATVVEQLPKTRSGKAHRHRAPGTGTGTRYDKMAPDGSDLEGKNSEES